MLNDRKAISTRYFVFILLIILLALSVTSASAYTEGPYNPASGTSVGGIGSEPWLNPGQVTQPGDPYASVLLYHLHTDSNYLQGNQYGFNIPPDVVITGIEVMINRMSSANSPGIHDSVVSLVKNGTVVGINHAIDARWPTVMTLATYGGPGDLWGMAWTPAEINSPEFGVALAAYRDNNGNSDRYANVDSLQVTVYYGYATTSGVVCGDGSPVMYGESLTCIATVSRLASSMTPGGEVYWTSEHGSFTPNPCVLSGADGVSTCSAEYTPTSVGTGAHTIVANYAGDGYFAPSSDSTTVTVLPRPVTVTADPQTKTYGAPDPELTYQVTQGSLVFGDTFTGALVRQPGEAVGVYAILQGTLSLSDNYVLTYLGDFLTILKADATCDISPYNVVYDGNAHTASGSCTGVLGEPLEGLDLSGTSHTAIGLYPDDPWTFVDVTGNYDDQSGTVGNQITVRFITVTADALSKVVRQPDPVLTFQVTLGSLLPGDVFTGVLVRQAGERIGSYAILQGSLSLPDYYQVTYVGADFTITGVIYMLPLVLR